MKPFLCAFLLLTLCFLGVASMGLMLSFPIPGNEPVPDQQIEQAKLGSQLADRVMLPARWAGDAAPFIGAALWAIAPSFIFACLWCRFVRTQPESGLRRG
jgi:hypothetical protein